MNQLEHAAEFRKLLANYQPSELTIQVLKEVRLVLLVGPTSTGRNTLVNELVKHPDYYHIVSDTSRERRMNDGKYIEENGREYWFRSEAEVLEGVRKGEYMEAAVIHNQQVSGCNVRELEAAHKANKIAIKDIEPSGAQFIHKLKPDATIIFMVAPSFDIWMERIHERGQMAPDELDRRMESAERELSTALKCDYYRFFVNDTLEGTTVKVNDFILHDQYDPFRERLARDTVKRLYDEVEIYLGDRARHTLNWR